MAIRSKLLHRLRTDTSGNIMYMTAGLLLPILATIGAGVDLGQAYMAKARLQQACDAGVLAGRRAMSEGSYTGHARGAARRMFQFNYPDDIYNSREVAFESDAVNASDVEGTASAEISTVIMHIFGKDTFQLNVDCAARLEIANTDIMMVLDTTGSMLQVNPGDSSNRMVAMRQEVMSFYDTVASAQSDGSIVRYGVMPYSSNVNVGRILRASDPEWISDLTEMPSREPNFEMRRPPDNTTYDPPFEDNFSRTNWSNTSTYFTGYTASACNNIQSPPSSSAIATNSGSSRVTGSTVDGNGNTVTTYEFERDYRRTEYRYRHQSSNNRCYRQSRTADYTYNRPYTVTQFPPVRTFVSYTYLTKTIDVSDVRSGNTFETNTGVDGADVTATWNGCIMERDTIAFASGIVPPADALDLDIDLVPNGEDRTKWRIYLPNIAYAREEQPYYAQTPSPVTTTQDYPNYANPTLVANGWAACPSEAMRLRAIPTDQRSVLQNYVNGLVAVGGTYHDVGMVWGTRFISPTGIFAGDNASAPNGRPISRHIIFMTDGDMAPNAGIYGFQGQEYTMGRVGSTNTAELTARHNTRFQTACNSAKSRNITVWVISFGVALNDQMRQCASSNNAFQASNRTELHDRFQQIAAQITRLRLSQ